MMELYKHSVPQFPHVINDSICLVGISEDLETKNI